MAEKVKLKLLASLLKWFHFKYYDGKMAGEAGNNLTTIRDIVNMYIEDAWRRK